VRYGDRDPPLDALMKQEGSVAGHAPSVVHHWRDVAKDKQMAYSSMTHINDPKLSVTLNFAVLITTGIYHEITWWENANGAICRNQSIISWLQKL
jgi:hypothetical protein